MADMVDTACLVKAPTNLGPHRLAINASCITILCLTQILRLAKFTFFMPIYPQYQVWFNKTVVIWGAEIAI